MDNIAPISDHHNLLIKRGQAIQINRATSGIPEIGNPLYEYQYIEQYLKRTSFGLLMLDLWIIWKGIQMIVKGEGH